MQLMEMQTAMERAKDNIEESVSRAKIEKADKDKRIQQLENEGTNTPPLVYYNPPCIYVHDPSLFPSLTSIPP